MPRTPLSHLPIESRMLAAKVAIHNALDDADILARLTELGYNENKLQQGNALVEAVDVLHKKQQVEYGDQYEATDDLLNKWEEANRAYMRAVKVARIAFRDNIQAQTGLQISGRRKKTIAGWIDQATVFYHNLKDDQGLMDVMAEFGYTPEKIDADIALVDAVILAHRVQDQTQGTAQDATKSRDAQIDAMDAWMSDYVAIARIALDAHPQQLEKLGVFVES